MTTSNDYQWLFRRAPAMATSIGRDGCYLDVNDALLDRLGYTREEMIGRRPAEFVTPESAERIEKEFLPKLRRTGRLENKPIAFVSKSGEVVNCLTNSVIEHDPDGKYIRTIAMYMEVADQARADWKYRQLYRSTPAMLHTLDARGCIVTVTDRWLSKMGYSREEVIGRPIVDFYAEEDRRRYAGKLLERSIMGGEFTNEERRMVTREGKVLELLQSAVCERDSSGRVYRMLVASKDVTERNAVERALRAALAENARLREELERERDYLREEVNVSMNFGRIVGRSPALMHMLAQVEAVAQTPANVLILGETGVGKELVARAIHARSPRANAPLVKVNCASIPKDLFESEFFGHVKGAFTGAHRDRVGRFQLADGGTLFMDEVGEIPLELQGKLLRVLQEREFERVGDDATRRVDVRVIAATNRDLEQLVAEGRFREDLYYRLSVFPVEVPPLRQRGQDVVQLAQHFLDITCKEFGRKPIKLTRAQAEALMAYDWPGNVRELKNVIERAVILSQGNVLRLELSLPETAAASGTAKQRETEPPQESVLTEKELKALQKKNILAALKQANWRVSGKGGAAELLGIRPTTLNDRIRTFGIKKPH
ncbi:MAG TPA: sigma 54-interacting transcriptional regulator [Woeseiaceae bacterium]|nr:sigma 54-interacting transcriptional regulator [Woeseiaceae bacterium]